MDKTSIQTLLKNVQQGSVSVEQAMDRLRDLPFENLDYAMVDHHRSLRVGCPEVIYGEGKTCEQCVGIVRAMHQRGNNILITRASQEIFVAVQGVVSHAEYNYLGRTISIYNTVHPPTPSYIAIVAAGTSDLPVVEEAYETARILGNTVQKITDVGVAGLHRLFSRLDLIRKAKVIIVVAGMEGALASVVGGLVDKPIIAVPTSVGYGASFGGLAALLTMLNSCASGVTVVNIDNGFGAAYSASQINKL
ncbi:MAG: NCAIR mutase-like protein [Bacillota bacterium]|nr:MAG: NCAIR mutase-like protein [Bacillota bacterium]MBS3950494.1 nickel pincer cofactor biosynthesis protein LarB [Peptococcaceae bacterium]